MKKLKKILNQSDQVQVISKDDAEKLKGGNMGFLFRGNIGPCFLCNPEDSDG